MLESILYFLLGFLAAGLLALMISPAIWNRAVQLTQERIESSVPLTLNEVQADKDQLRAEFAMSTRRLELSVEELREKASRQIIEINRKRDDLNKLAEESAEKVRAIEVLEATKADLTNTLREREEQLDALNTRLNDTQSKLESKTLELSTTRDELASVRNESDSRQIELVAKETSVGNLQDEVIEHKRKTDRLNEEIRELKTEIYEFKSKLELAEGARKDSEERQTRIQEQLADTEEQLERTEREVTRLRLEAGEETGNSSQLSKENIDLRSKNVELESKLAETNLQIEKLLNDASNPNVKAALETFEREGLGNSEPMRALKQERDDLKKQVEAYQKDKADSWNDDRRENAILRERINDLAAQITAMTASLEGDGSPIHDILEQKLDEKRKQGTGAMAKEGEPLTLADRIRALQQTAKEASNS